MRTTLIITTYNRPKALSLVLQTVGRQSVLPDEVIVADDGSSESTARVVRRFQKISTIPIIHAFQEDKGFRVSRARNLGVSMCSGEFLVFIDGDIPLHRDFIKSHKALIRKGVFLNGSRVMLTHKTTQKIIDQGRVTKINPFNVPLSHRFKMIHNLPLARVFSFETKDVKSRSCNLSVYKDDYINVNGFNEDFEGWGYEDSEFVWRLMKSGIKKIKIRFSAVCYHLDHRNSNELYDPKQTEKNGLLFEEVQNHGMFKCKNGYRNHTKIAEMALK